MNKKLGAFLVSIFVTIGVNVKPVAAGATSIDGSGGVDVRLNLSCTNGLAVLLNDVTAAPGKPLDTFAWVHEPGEIPIYRSVQVILSGSQTRTIVIPNLFCSESLVEQSLSQWLLVEVCEGKALPASVCVASR